MEQLVDRLNDAMHPQDEDDSEEEAFKDEESLQQDEKKRQGPPKMKAPDRGTTLFGQLGPMESSLRLAVNKAFLAQGRQLKQIAGGSNRKVENAWERLQDEISDVIKRGFRAIEMSF